MLPDWYANLSAATGSAYLAGWTNADVAALSLLAFLAFYLLATVMAANWPGEVALLALVAGGLLVTWPAMIVLTRVAVAWAIVVGGLHACLAPERNARIAAEADRQVAPVLDRFARDAGLSDAQRRRLFDNVAAEQGRR